MAQSLRALLNLVVLAVALLMAPMAWANPVDLNTASAGELDTLPGIGPSKAAAIVTYRTENGPFATIDALDAVPGIGPATLAGLRDQVTVAGGGANSTGAAASAPVTAASAASTTAPAPSGGVVNINTATAAELVSLPGIGATKAATIIEDRNVNGPFASCSDMVRVTGVGPATIANLGGHCTTAP